MSVLSEITLHKVLVTLSAIAGFASANAPLSAHEHTETAMPQELGVLTTDGMLVYSMNHCIVTMTTNCEVSLSTGPPAVETPGKTIPVTDPYPIPTGETSTPGEGEPDVPGEPGIPGAPTEPEEPTDASNTASLTPSETDDEPTPTKSDGDTGTGTGANTETAVTGTATSGANALDVFDPTVVGLVGMAVAYLV